MENRFPKLRLLEYKPLLYDGKPFIYLRDPLQLSEKTILIPQPLAPVLAFCDGTRDLSAISAMIATHYGLQISINVIDGLVEVLDKAYLLENQRFGEKQEEAREAYRRAAFRPACCAGHTYPDDRTTLLEYFARTIDSQNRDDPHPNARGLISPHIDYGRGGEVYGRVWQAAAQAVQAADVIVIFGTDHAGNDLFTLTRQNYATPLGILPTDIKTVDALARVLGEGDAFCGELRHTSEHSVELAAAWCQYIWQQGKVDPMDGCPQIIPILTGDISLVERAQQCAPTIDQFIETLQASLSGKRVLYVAAADLAHVGPAFDGAPLDEDGKRILEGADREILALISAGDAEGFLAAIQGVQNRNNICGVTPIYLTLRMVQPAHGVSLGYALCPADEAGTSMVSVCGIILE